MLEEERASLFSPSLSLAALPFILPHSSIVVASIHRRPDEGRKEEVIHYLLLFLSGIVAISAASDLKNESRETISIFFIDASGGGRDGLPSSRPPPPRRRPTQYDTSHPWKYRWPAEAVLYISIQVLE